MRKPMYAPRLIAVTLLSVLAAAASATIRYRVSPMPDTKQVAVEIEIPVRSNETLVQIPRWRPGAYILGGAGANLKDFVAIDEDGKNAPVVAQDDQTWKVTSSGRGSILLKYTAPMEFADGIGHYSGPTTYVYVVGRTQEDCLLHVDLPSTWKIAIGLDGSRLDYKADTYDVLADNPVTMGDYIEQKYKVAGKTHIIALRGPSAKTVDMAQLLKECQFVSQMETDFMGGAPYNKYVWHFSARPGPGGGGLEHLSSTQITFGTDLVAGRPGLFAHEFFHLWNVKRIRSRVLGPFDYTKLPKTGALWWLEGVTEYYAQALLGRYKWSTEAEWYKTAAANVLRLRTIPERLTVSTYDSSYRVDETNGGKGNSNGFGFSYYDAGFVVGLCLDLELIGQTGGKKSLDDVELALWKLCRDNKPGFAEDEIRKQLILAGGPSFGAMYDKMVMTPGELPVEAALAQVGLELGTKTEMRGDMGFTVQPSAANTAMEVSATQSDGAKGALPVGTVIKSINGRAVSGGDASDLRRSYARAIANMPAGADLKLSVVLPGATAETEVSFKAGSVPVSVGEIRSVASPTREQLRLRGIWLAKHR